MPPFHDLSLSITIYHGLLGLRCNIQTFAVSSLCAQLGQEKSSLITIPFFASLSAVCTCPNQFQITSALQGQTSPRLIGCCPINFLAAWHCFLALKAWPWIRCFKVYRCSPATSIYPCSPVPKLMPNISCIRVPLNTILIRMLKGLGPPTPIYIYAYSFIHLFVYESDVIRQADVPFKHRLDADGSAACAIQWVQVNKGPILLSNCLSASRVSERRQNAAVSIADSHGFSVSH